MISTFYQYFVIFNLSCNDLYFLVTLPDWWDLSSPTGDWTWVLSSESTQPEPLDRQGIPIMFFFMGRDSVILEHE